MNTEERAKIEALKHRFRALHDDMQFHLGQLLRQTYAAESHEDEQTRVEQTQAGILSTGQLLQGVHHMITTMEQLEYALQQQAPPPASFQIRFRQQPAGAATWEAYDPETDDVIMNGWLTKMPENDAERMAAKVDRTRYVLLHLAERAAGGRDV